MSIRFFVQSQTRDRRIGNGHRGNMPYTILDFSLRGKRKWERGKENQISAFYIKNPGTANVRALSYEPSYLRGTFVVPSLYFPGTCFIHLPFNVISIRHTFWMIEWFRVKSIAYPEDKKNLRCYNIMLKQIREKDQHITKL